MIQQLSHATVFVPDQQAAIDFYVGVLGFELTMDMSMPNGFRWVNVSPKGQPGFNLILAKPNQGPNMTEEDKQTVLDLVAKGAFGAGVFQTADCRATYAELKAKGVEFSMEPKDQFYGVEAVFRDPFGNWFSLTEPKPMAAPPTA
jgi:catechol 2,3-dioxygenase-like lactoylglutathione lyase family enzyme